MSLIHYADHTSLKEAIIGFIGFCRKNDLEIGINHTEEALKCADLGFVNDLTTFRFALKSLFCNKLETHELFNKCFDTFWLKRKHNYAHKINQTTTNVVKKTNGSLVMMGFKPNGAEEQDETEQAKSVTGVSKIEALKQTDFSKVSAIDNVLLDQIAEQLLRQLNHRLKRKFSTDKQGKIDIRKSIRRNLSNGDLLLDLSYKRRKTEKVKLNLLLDVSGSMDKYSFFLLKFIWSLKSNLKNLEAFVFSTHLVRISDYLRKEKIDHTLLKMGQQINNWSGGTKIGECLAEFNQLYSKRILNGKSVTIILSDGLDDGNAKLLAAELQKIKMRTSKLIWLNPLKGMKNYQPLANGMKAAIPLVDTFETAHNLNSLLQLENILADV